MQRKSLQASPLKLTSGLQFLHKNNGRHCDWYGAQNQGDDHATHCHLPHCSPWLGSGTLPGSLHSKRLWVCVMGSDHHGTVRRKSQNKSIQVYLSKCQEPVQRFQLSTDNSVEILDKPFNLSRIWLFYLEIISCDDLKSQCSINMLQL